MNGPKVITVSGASAGVGKTRLIERLMPLRGSVTAVKAQAARGGPARVHEEADPAHGELKDTGRYLAAGARRALLLTGPPGELLALARQVIAEATTEVLIFETTALAAELEPELAFFVAGRGPAKPGAERCRRLADVLVTNVTGR